LSSPYSVKWENGAPTGVFRGWSAELGYGIVFH
jgi:hypothetical protein